MNISKNTLISNINQSQNINKMNKIKVTVQKNTNINFINQLIKKPSKTKKEELLIKKINFLLKQKKELDPSNHDYDKKLKLINYHITKLLVNH